MDARLAAKSTVVLAVLGVWLSGCAPSGQAVLNLPLPELAARPAPAEPQAQTLPHAAPVLAPVSPVVPPPAAAGAPGDHDRAWAVADSLPWRYIVLHHSGTDTGSAASFDQTHRRRGWDELGYHFVITNGRGGPDGGIEVGGRWASQKHGAHTGGTPENVYNELGIGICLVGDFDRYRPTAAQLASLDRLVAYLRAMYDIPPGNVIGHGEAPTSATACPGRHLHEHIGRQFRSETDASVAGHRRP